MGGSTVVTTRWRGRGDHRRQWRYWAGDRAEVCPRRRVRLRHGAPSGRVGQKGGREVMRVLSTLRRGWIPLVLVAVVALSGFTISRMHGIFGSNQSAGASGGGVDQIVPFNPKRVLYEVYARAPRSAASATSTRTPSRSGLTSRHCRGHFWLRPRFRRCSPTSWHKGTATLSLVASASTARSASTSRRPEPILRPSAW